MEARYLLYAKMSDSAYFVMTREDPLTFVHCTGTVECLRFSATEYPQLLALQERLNGMGIPSGICRIPGESTKSYLELLQREERKRAARMKKFSARF